MSTPTADQPRASRPLLIALAVVVVAAVAFLTVVLLGSPDDDVATPAAGPSETLPGAASETAVAVAPDDAVGDATEAPSEIAAVEPTFEVFSARDPFEQLVAAGNAGDGDTVGTTQPTSDTAPVDGTAPTATPGTPSQTVVGSTTILLEEIFGEGGTDKALIVVDDEGFEAGVGDTVAGKVTVLDIAGSCATMRFEDKRFILCEGEQIQK